MRVRVLAVLLITAGPFAPTARAADKAIEFNRDIRPILSNNCFVCHGPDNNLRKADLRLDQDKGLYDDRDGGRIIAPGKPMESEMFQRITSPEKAKRMPPAKANKELTKEQVELIRTWIEQGGKYQKHWSLIAPVKTEAAPVKNSAWVRNPIDAFILARLEKEGMAPSPEADPRTLIRRWSFDLLGLPPSPGEVDEFTAAWNAPGAKRQAVLEKLVDRLLASQHFGERMALYWLDLVRYADTGGYHSDNHRDVALYRDWVIDAFNKNKRFDKFTIEQLAGDLLPNATSEQKIASGYNRLLQTTEEGGAQAKEYLAKYAADRVRNAGSVWLGLTLGCAECHNHKFDPVSTKEFYRFASFWADIREVAVGRQPQTKMPTPEQLLEKQKVEAAVAADRKLLDTPTAELAALQKLWEKEALADLEKTKSIWTAIKPEKVASSGKT